MPSSDGAGEGTELRGEGWFHALFESAPDALVIVDDQARIVEVNGLTEECFQYDREELAGRAIEVLVPEELTEKHRQLREEFMRSPHKRTGVGLEMRGRRKDGTEFPVGISLSPIHTPRGSFIIASVRDITERKRMEADLRQRTIELERSNRDLEDFTYVASHDLREPLRGISSLSTVLSEDYGESLDEEGRNMLGVLPRLAQRLDSLIDDLLQYTRVGGGDLTIEEVPMDEVLERVLETLTPMFDAEGVQVDVQTPMPDVFADRKRIEQVLVNLLTNAARHNDKADKRIEIGSVLPERFPQSEGRPVLFVRDNGLGIPSKHQDTVFRIFKRLYGREQFGHGTGAGLTIARKIVEHHGGRMWLESEPGKGSAFYFTLSGPSSVDA